MKTVRNSNAYNKAISDYYGGLAGAVEPIPNLVHELNHKPQLVLEGWLRLHDDKVLGDFLYGGMQVAKGEQHEYTIHCSPVLSVMIQCKRRKR